MPGNEDIARSLRWRRFIAETMSNKGVPATATVRPRGRASEAVARDETPLSDIVAGSFSIAAPAKRQADLGTYLDQAQRAAEVDGLKHAATVLFRRGGAVGDCYVTMSLTTFCSLLVEREAAA